MAVRVSVVIAVYNTGPHIEPLIDSLLRQTMSTEEFEVIFVDDGSTDSTPDRLDALAAEHGHFTVVREPNSGWPGRPRNVGIDLARGRYVFFADHDDWFGVEALQRMLDYAEAHESDILIGRYAGHHRGVAKAMFTANRPAVTLSDTPLMDSLTPHKLYRAAFLAEHELRFPEGRRRLEDHMFVIAAYFRARRISLLADYHCYFHIGRPDIGNAGLQRIDPPFYYRYAREVVELILAETEPGALRDRCLRRPLRQELLGRLDGAPFLKEEPDHQRSVFDEARAIALACIPPHVDRGLSAPQQVRSEQLRANRFADLTRYVRHQVGVRCHSTLADLRWDDRGRLTVTVDALLVNGPEARPWTYRVDGDRMLLTTPALEHGPAEDALDCTAAVRAARADLVIRRRADSEEWKIPTESTRTTHTDGDAAWLSFHAVGVVDPRTLGGGRLLTPGVWDLYVTVSQTGWSKQNRLAVERLEPALAGCRPAVLSGVPIVAYWTAGAEKLSLNIDAKTAELAKRPGRCRLERSAGGSAALVVDLDLALDADARPAVALRLTPASSSSSSSAVVLAAGWRAAEAGVATLAAQAPDLAPGAWRVTAELQLPRGTVSWRTATVLVVGRRRSPRLRSEQAARRANASQRRGVLGRARRIAGRARRRARSVARRWRER
ncbi:glycosyltransferase family 2 protein [uncultured Jatrophihabitans sp.]|uniref:glycosyltransferase family 2 protein n=1 Tax=uncultured Jatrophihabitans sp. TaxID=1610747 RepID=UPI0035C994AC